MQIYFKKKSERKSLKIELLTRLSLINLTNLNNINKKHNNNK